MATPYRRSSYAVEGSELKAYPNHLLEVLPMTSDPEAIAALTPSRIAAARSRTRDAA
jgi:hypothetical protein